MFAQKQHGDRGRVGVRLDPDAELLTTQAGKGVLQDNQFRFLAHQLQRFSAVTASRTWNPAARSAPVREG